jgi:undecaprenyl-diphosphatase
LRRLDYRLFWLINGRLHTGFVDSFIRQVNRIDDFLGDAGSLVILLLVMAVWSWCYKGSRFISYFLFVAGIIILNILVGVIIKRVVKERRPLFVFGGKVRILSERRYRYSMPSGHTQVAFSLATLLSAQLPAYGWLFYLAAALIGIYRVYVGSHFPSDVVAGALLGVVITRFCLG